MKPLSLPAFEWHSIDVDHRIGLGRYETWTIGIARHEMKVSLFWNAAATSLEPDRSCEMNEGKSNRSMEDKHYAHIFKELDKYQATDSKQQEEEAHTRRQFYIILSWCNWFEISYCDACCKIWSLTWHHLVIGPAAAHHWATAAHRLPCRYKVLLLMVEDKQRKGKP